MRVLIDVDYLLHRTCWAKKSDLVHDDEIVTTTLNLSEALGALEEELAAIAARLGSSDLWLCVSDPSRRYFRHKILPTYKSSRTRPLPCGYSALRDKLDETRGLKWIPELEADDLLGIFATQGKEAAVVSIDKDLATIPCRLVNPDTWEERWISEEEADFNHHMQILTGDRGDDVPGLRRIGPVRARKLLAGISGPRQRWEVIVREYAKQGLAEHDAVRSGRVLRILRSEDFDDEQGIIPWRPPVA